MKELAFPRSVVSSHPILYNYSLVGLLQCFGPICLYCLTKLMSHNLSQPTHSDNFQTQTTRQRLLWSSRYLFPATFFFYFSTGIYIPDVSKFNNPKCNLKFLPSFSATHFPPLKKFNLLPERLITSLLPSCTMLKTPVIRGIFFIIGEPFSFIIPLISHRFSVLQL